MIPSCLWDEMAACPASANGMVEAAKHERTYSKTIDALIWFEEGLMSLHNHPELRRREKPVIVALKSRVRNECVVSCSLDKPNIYCSKHITLPTHQADREHFFSAATLYEGLL
jgi:hypothetical protein